MFCFLVAATALIKTAAICKNFFWLNKIIDKSLCINEQKSKTRSVAPRSVHGWPGTKFAGGEPN